jgi:hypothetical protein
MLISLAPPLASVTILFFGVLLDPLLPKPAFYPLTLFLVTLGAIGSGAIASTHAALHVTEFRGWRPMLMMSIA